MEAKRAIMLAKLDQRYKKPEMSNGKTDSIDIQHGGGDLSTDFQRRFYGEHASILKELELLRNELENSRSNSVTGKIDELVARLSKLQALLNESTSILANYEIRKATANLQDLQESLKKARLNAEPKKRFAFTKLNPAAKPITISSSATNGISTNGSDVTDGHANVDSHSIPSAAAVVVKGRRNDQSIVLSFADCHGKDVLLLDCHSCTIRLLGVATTVHAKELIDCTIVSYPVSTSVFVERCQRSVYVVACQQLRMHTSVDCDLYLHVTTRAIIEDCQRLRFAPYADAIGKGENVDELLEKADLDKANNSWNLVQDFNWLVDDKPSSNWQVLPCDQRRQFQLRIE